MSNTHRLEKLRLAEAPDKTKVWFKLPDKTDWDLSYAVMWRPETKYVVDDGFFVEERKYFAEYGVIYYYSSSLGGWVLTKATTWEEGVKYCITPPKPKWYELEENIGKLILVNSKDCREAACLVVEFEKYTADSEEPFTSSTGISWKYAWLIDPDTLAKG